MLWTLSVCLKRSGSTEVPYSHCVPASFVAGGAWMVRDGGGRHTRAAHTRAYTRAHACTPGFTTQMVNVYLLARLLVLDALLREALGAGIVLVLLTGDGDLFHAGVRVRASLDNLAPCVLLGVRAELPLRARQLDSGWWGGGSVGRRCFGDHTNVSRIQFPIATPLPPSTKPPTFFRASLFSARCSSKLLTLGSSRYFSLAIATWWWYERW